MLLIKIKTSRPPITLIWMVLFKNGGWGRGFVKKYACIYIRGQVIRNICIRTM